MKNAVIYARYSSDNQTEQSIEGQVRVCKEYADKNDFAIVNEYIDRAMTGTNDNRPAFQQMLSDSKKKGFEFVLVYKFDRSSRSRHDSAVNKAILKKNGVKVISATEQISDTPEGIILEGMLESFAEYYSAELSQKVKRGRKESLIKGQYVGGRIAFGYYVKDKKVYLHEQNAEIVKQVFNDYLSGMKLKDIADKLNNIGLQNVLGGKFCINIISRMLRNPIYTGRFYANDTVYTNVYPQIIDETTFDKVNKMLSVGKHTGAQKKAVVPFILSGKLICGKCYTQMTGDSGTGRNGIHYYYKCHNRKKNKACDKKTIEKNYIENYVVQATQAFLKNCKEIKQISEKVAEIFNKAVEQDNLLNSLNAQVKDIDRQLNNLANAIANGIFSKTTNEKLNSLEKQKEELEIKIAEQSVRKTRPIKAENVYNWIMSFADIDTTDLMACKRLIDMFVNKIILRDNDFDIIFRISNDDSQNIKLKNAEDYSNLCEEICNKKEQSTFGSDCSSLVRIRGLEPPRLLTGT